jgi:hypothetical protein
MMMLHSVRMARHINEKVRRLGYRGWIAWMINRQLGWGNLPIPWNETRGELQAQITDAVWFCSCPHCNTPVIVDDKEPVFFCPTCLCAANDGKPYAVTFRGKQAVEDLFAKRKDPRTRNWLQGETIQQLRTEQAARGEL